uniref:Reverse transcriptase Ty1/copia-type domain-containing protein n=1 Tax=Fagus sylvatica TaxID=28930 RepID=A0A2N9FW57_FAGSY
MNFAYQGKNPTTKLAAMASASNLHYTQNTETWLTDTGATDHITANSNNLSLQAPYQSQEQVSVGNGQNLPIQNIDNNCSCYFDAKKFSIQDLPTGRLLYKGLSNNGVYPIQSPLFIPAANKIACAAHSISLDKWHLWHSRLGHPSAKAKMHQLPFPTSNKTITSPFELVHADLWGPAPVVASNSFSHNTMVISPYSHESSAITPGQCPNPIVSAPDLTASYTSPTEPNVSPLSSMPLPTGFTANPAPIPTTSTGFIANPIPIPTASTPLSSMPLPTGFTANPTPIPTASAPNLPANPVPNTSPDTPFLFDNITSIDIPIPSVVSHPMQTRSKSDIYKPKLTYATLIDYAVTEPTSYTVASKHSSWCTAMDEEFQALQKQGTWSLVPLPPSKNVVGCKWVYKLKTHSDGTIARYKTRLVAKGFHQQYGIDFNETFSPVIKPPIVRLVLSLAVSLNWPLRQLDVKNAFLHGTLKEEVYMTQPQGYIDPIHPQYVSSNADSSLFIYTENKIIAYLLLYVDDIVLTSNTPTFLDALIHKLSSVFDLKDLGSLHYFLELQVTRTLSRLYINQAKYAQDLLKKHNMLDCKPASSPSCPNTRLSLHDGDPLPDPHAYRSMVGALHYLTFTRPDISFAVHQVCQYMSTPTTTHLAAAKLVLRYIRGTFNHGIKFTPGPLSLSAYTDADWAGDPDDCRSTSGFLVYLGHNAITWSAKKQATVSRSSTESEYQALAIASAELC